MFLLSPTSLWPVPAVGSRPRLEPLRSEVREVLRSEVLWKSREKWPEMVQAKTVDNLC